WAKMLLPDGDEVEAIAPSHLPFLGTVAEMLSRPLHHAWHWSITQIVGHSLPASQDSFANSCWNVWRCGRGDTRQTPADGSRDIIGEAVSRRRALRSEPRAVAHLRRV